MLSSMEMESMRPQIIHGRDDELARDAPKPAQNDEAPAELIQMFQNMGPDHDLVKKYQPQYLGFGSDHIVYDIPKHPNIVAKVDVQTFKPNIDWNIAHGEAPDALSPNLVAQMKEGLKGESARYQLMTESFGAKYVLPFRAYVIKVPVSQEFLEHLYKNLQHNQPNPASPPNIMEVPAIVRIQKRSQGLADPNHITFTDRFGEFNLDACVASTEHLVFSVNAEQKLPKETFLNSQEKKIQELLDRAEDSENFKRCLREFVELAVRYTKATGEILDIGGKNNVVFFQRDGTWTFELVDALYWPENTLETARDLIARIDGDSQLSRHEIIQINNFLDYTRTINGLAEMLDIEGRVHIEPDGMGEPPTKLRDVIEAFQRRA